MKDIFRKNERANVLSWILRIFLILVILFFIMFSFDVFEEGKTFSQMLTGFLIHNIFSFIMIIILVLAWKREHIGGILLVCIAIFMVFFFGGPLGMMYGTWIMISLPFITGILFIMNYYVFTKNKKNISNLKPENE